MTIALGIVRVFPTGALTSVFRFVRACQGVEGVAGRALRSASVAAVAGPGFSFGIAALRFAASRSASVAAVADRGFFAGVPALRPAGGVSVGFSGARSTSRGGALVRRATSSLPSSGGAVASGRVRVSSSSCLVRLLSLGVVLFISPCVSMGRGEKEKSLQLNANVDAPTPTSRRSQ